jgi:hypothetical protein
VVDSFNVCNIQRLSSLQKPLGIIKHPLPESGILAKQLKMAALYTFRNEFPAGKETFREKSKEGWCQAKA